MRRRTIARTALLSLLLLLVALSSCVSQFRAGPGLTIFRKATFDFILPDCRPAAGETVQELSLRATPGEIEPLSFGVYGGQSIPSFTFTVSDLTGPNGARIPASALDPRVAQVWEQKGLRGKGFVTLTVPEALIKDDSLNWLDPGYTSQNLPSVPADAPIRTSLPANQAKQFFLIAHLPDDAPAGDYRGTVRLGDPANPTEVPLTIRVLPFTLRDHGKTIGMYYNDTLKDTPLPLYRARLAMMRSLGVTALRILDDEQYLPQELQEIKAAGFTGPIIPWNENALTAPGGDRRIREMVAALQAAGYEPYIYAVDEPNNPNLPPRQSHSMQGQLIAYQRIKQAGGKVATALTRETEETLMAQHGQKLDFPLYAAQDRFGLPEYVARIRANPNARDHPFEGYYFGSWGENPRRSRLLTGFYLHESGLNAVFGWTFYTYHIPRGQLFSDFDLEGNKKRWFTVFPTREGAAPTIQSEAFREGVDDLRYLATFLAVAEQKGPQGAQLRNRVLQSLDRFSDYGPANPPDEMASQFSNAEFDQARQRIIEATLTLMGQ